MLYCTCTFILYSSFSLLAMDMNIELQEVHHYKSSPKSSTKNPRTLDSVINQAINKKQSSWNIIQDPDHLDIIKTIHECYPNCIITSDLIEKLKRNEKFKDAMEYFTKIILYNHMNITPQQLTQIKNRHNPLLSSACYHLPLEIRHYILNSIREHNNYSYSIKLKNRSMVKKFALCGNQHLAATYHTNKTINLWNLKNGTIITSLSKIGAVFSIAFNYRGTQLAIGCNNKSGKKTIKIFDPSSLDLLLMIPSRCNDIEYITYPHSGNDFQSSVLYAFNFHNKIMYTWLIEQKGYTYLGMLFNSGITPINNAVESGDYTINNIPTTRLSIKKKSYPLFLCTQALQSIQNEKDIETIKSSPLYTSLTQYEQNLFEKRSKKQLQSCLINSLDTQGIIQWE